VRNVLFFMLLLISTFVFGDPCEISEDCGTECKDNIMANVQEVAGNVEYKSRGGVEYVTLEVAQEIKVGDSISTDVDSGVVLSFGSKGTLRIYELSHIKINEMFKDADLQKLQIFLRTGSVETVSPPETLIRSDFTVKTPVAIAGIRGSDMIVGSSENEDQVVAIEHDACVKGESDETGKKVSEGHYASVIDGKVGVPKNYIKTKVRELRGDEPEWNEDTLIYSGDALSSISIVDNVLKIKWKQGVEYPRVFLKDPYQGERNPFGIYGSRPNVPLDRALSGAFHLDLKIKFFYINEFGDNTLEEVEFVIPKEKACIKLNKAYWPVECRDYNEKCRDNDDDGFRSKADVDAGHCEKGAKADCDDNDASVGECEVKFEIKSPYEGELIENHEFIINFDSPIPLSLNRGDGKGYVQLTVDNLRFPEENLIVDVDSPLAVQVPPFHGVQEYRIEAVLREHGGDERLETKEVYVKVKNAAVIKIRPEEIVEETEEIFFTIIPPENYYYNGADKSKLYFFIGLNDKVLKKSIKTQKGNEISFSHLHREFNPGENRIVVSNSKSYAMGFESFKTPGQKDECTTLSGDPLTSPLTTLVFPFYDNENFEQEFQKDFSRLLRNVFIYQPLKSYQEHFAFRRVKNNMYLPECDFTKRPSIDCYQSIVRAKENSCPAQKAIIMVDGSGPKDIDGTTDSNTIIVLWMKKDRTLPNILAHEMGHWFMLQDEYNTNNPLNPYRKGYNCATSEGYSIPGWKDLVGSGEGSFRVGYYKGCTTGGSLRPHKISLMDKYIDDLSHENSFGLVNQLILCKKIAEYTKAYSSFCARRFGDILKLPIGEDALN
jgi:hypothetical protein